MIFQTFINQSLSHIWFEFIFQITERSGSVQIFYLLALIKEIKVRELFSDVEPLPKQFVEALKKEFARKNLQTVQVYEKTTGFSFDILFLDSLKLWITLLWNKIFYLDISGIYNQKYLLHFYLEICQSIVNFANIMIAPVCFYLCLRYHCMF